MDVVSPVIVSASRATDIPALYGEWLLGRLRAGWCVRVNRFNARRQRVSFERTRAIVFWTKNPAPLIPRLTEIDALGFNYYFTFTLNDYEPEGLEPGVPSLAARIETFRRLSQRLGPERVVWRFDPILLGDRLTPETILGRIGRVGEAVRRHTRKLVVSFADVAPYRWLHRRLRPDGAGGFGEPDPAAVAKIAAGVGGLCRTWGLEVAACAEPADLSAFGIGPNRCVDDALLARIFPADTALQEFLRGGGRWCRRVGNARCAGGAHPLKDPGQRVACGCIVSRDIGRYGTCTQGCAYCYANVSHDAAARSRAQHDPGAESI